MRRGSSGLSVKKSLHYLASYFEGVEIDTTRATNAEFAVRVDFPAGYAGKAYWEMSDGGVVPATSAQYCSYYFTVTGTKKAVLRGVPLSTITRIYANTQNIVSDIGAFSKCTAMSDMQMGNNFLMTGNINSIPVPKTIMILNSDTLLQGDIGELVLPTGFLNLNLNDCTHIVGDLSDMAIPASMTTLRLQNTGITVSGALDFGESSALKTVNLKDCTLSVAHVGNVIDSIYTNRAIFTYTTPDLDISGSNGTPEGTSTNPTVTPGNGNTNADWEWSAGLNHHVPLTPMAKIYVLENDPFTEGFYTWAITASS